MGASSDSPVANSPKPDQHEAAPEVDLAQVCVYSKPAGKWVFLGCGFTFYITLPLNNTKGIDALPLPFPFLL